MDTENIIEKDEAFWSIEQISDDEKAGKHYTLFDQKKSISSVPLFFSRKDAEIFFTQEYINPEKWRVAQMRLSYINAILFLVQKQDWNLKLFYSYDAYNKGWGVKDITISLQENYYKG